jgi:ribosomal protein S20
VASAYDKAAKKGVVHANKAANKKSSLTKLANTLA